MRINILYIGFLGCVLALASCNKIDPPVIIDPELPNFEVDLNVGSSTVSLIAGDRNYFMNTSWERGNDGVHTFIGNLAQYDCFDQCAEQLTIKIRDYQQAETPLVDITGALPINQDFAFAADSATIATPDTTTWNISAEDNLTLGTAQYTWFINGAIQNSSFDELSFTSTTTDKILVDLIIQSDTLTNPLTTSRYFGAVSSPQGLGVELGVSGGPQTFWTLEAIASGGVAPYSYLWSTGESTVTIVNSPIVDDYAVTVTDSNADTTKTTLIFQNPNSLDSSFYYSNISANVMTSFGQDGSDPNPLDLGIITIEYTTADGQFYSTELGSQSPSASFIITNIEEYAPNSNGDAVKQLLLNFNCKVFTEMGESLNIFGEESLFGIAYPAN